MAAPTELLTRVKQLITAVGSTPSTGQGDLSLGTVYDGDATLYRFDDVATSGQLYSYVIREGTKEEHGRGKPISGTPWTFQRTTVIRSTAGVGVLESFTTAAVIWCTSIAEDFSDRDVRGRHGVYLPAAAFTPAVSNGPATTSAEMSTNKNVVNTLDFDAATVESAQVSYLLPPSFDAANPAIRARVLWKHPSTSTNFGAVFRLSAVAVADGAALDAAFGTAVSVADTGGTTNYGYLTSETADITPGGTAQPLKLLFIKLERLATDGSDTMAVDAQVLGIELYFNVNAAVD